MLKTFVTAYTDIALFQIKVWFSVYHSLVEIQQPSDKLNHIYLTTSILLNKGWETVGPQDTLLHFQYTFF